MPVLTDAELYAFLDEPGHLVRLATTDETGMPLVVPAWFIRDGNRLLVTPRARSSWWRHLRRDPRTCFSVDEDPTPYRKLTAQGTIEIVHAEGQDDAWRAVYRSIATRYTSEAGADAYLHNTRAEPRALIALDLAATGTTLSSWRMPVAGEDPSSVWAPRYYHR